MIDVQYATPADTGQIQIIVQSAFETVRNVYRPRPDVAGPTDSKDPGGRFIVARNPAAIFGITYLHVESDMMRVSLLAVLPAYRRMGVARALLKFAARSAAKAKLTEIRITTIAETGNVAFFEKIGFVAVRTSVAAWCVSDRFARLTDVEMALTANAP